MYLLGNTPPPASAYQSLWLQWPLGWAAHWQAPPRGSELLPASTSAKGSRGMPGGGVGASAHPPVEIKPWGGAMPTTPTCQAAGLPGELLGGCPKRRGHP